MASTSWLRSPFVILKDLESLLIQSTWFRNDVVEFFLDWRTPVATAVGYLLFVAAATTFSRKYLAQRPHAASTSQGASSEGGKSPSSSIGWRPWFCGSDLKALSVGHDLILIGASATMFVGCFSAVVDRVQRTSADFLLCEDPNLAVSLFSSGVKTNGNEQTLLEVTTEDAVNRLFLWSFLYYLSKYYELLDTILQLARGRPPPQFFLHVYHHSCVLVMGWAWCTQRMSLQFIGLLSNTFVHVVMYSYYLQRAVTGKVPSWKRWVTQVQILQFALSVGCFLYTISAFIVPGMQCGGWPVTMVGNILFNLMLLRDFCNLAGKNAAKEKKG
ncbi:unnamed protein product [Amoebophrya sp. A25]|nr:unnamed protein product [Amoebophrya sp. A25]|eukprot:GSA25T00018211001.1